LTHAATPTRLKLSHALGGVLLVALPFFFMLGATAGAAVCFAALAGLLLGRLSARGGQTPDTSLPSHQTLSPRALLALEAAKAAPPAGALLAATMNGMREGVLAVDGSLRIVTVNDAARVLFSRAHGALSGEPLSALTRNPAIHAAYSAALERGEDNQVKVELVGAERHVLELRVAPLMLDETHATRGAIGVFFDITQLERLERVRQEFLSNVSHELRTPLTAILTFVETLEEGALDDPEHSRRFVGIIGRNAARMHTLIEDILELSAIESGGTQVEARQVRLSPVVQEILSSLGGKAEARGVALVNEVRPEAVVFADPRRLEQMLLNLVDNAIKFNRAGGVVTVGHEAGGASDLVTVSDTGEGIPQDQLPRIFERFYRVDHARSREMGGTGLGLAIVKHLARAHGGEVCVRSAVNEGSTFTIELPRVQNTDQNTERNTERNTD
jgi:two-component system phosphate regulon sensor histidine kinase PhoR